MHTVEDLENTLKDIFITTESTYNQQVELENLLEEVDPQSLIRTIWENSETIYSFRTEKNREQCMEYTHSTGTFLIGGESPSRMKVRQDPPDPPGNNGKQGGERFRTILKYPLATDKAMKRFRDNDTSLWGWRRTRRG